MPAYDFKCTSCSTVFEINRPMSTIGDASCPACGSVAKKVFSPVGVSFKGTGFHNTDYRPREKSSEGAPVAPAPS
jgi:putative FmdB family regulatory protein